LEEIIAAAKRERDEKYNNILTNANKKLRNITNNYDKTSINNSQTIPQNKIFNNINNINVILFKIIIQQIILQNYK